MAVAAVEEVRIGSRDEERFAVGAVVEAQGRPGRFLVQVDDLSLTGARIRCPAQRLIPDDWLVLDLSLAPRRASIVWVEGMMAGCEFTEPLDPVVLRIILKALTPSEESPAPDQINIPATAGTYSRSNVDAEGGLQGLEIAKQIYPPRYRNFRC